MNYYAALIHKQADSDYGVSFPDFPGCVTAGKSYEEAIVLAAEALAFHVEGMQADGLKIPGPRSVKAIKAADEAWVDFEDATIAMAPLLPAAAGRPQATNLSLDSGLVEAVDHYASKARMTRSAVFAEGAKLFMQMKPAGEYRVARDPATGELKLPGVGRLLRATSVPDIPIRNTKPRLARKS